MMRTISNFLVNRPKGTVCLKYIDASHISKTVDKIFKMLDEHPELKRLAIRILSLIHSSSRCEQLECLRDGNISKMRNMNCNVPFKLT